MQSITEDRPKLWTNPTFFTLFSSAMFVAFGQQIYNLALPLLVYDLTQSSQMMGWMRATEFLPNLLLALFIGVWVDRFEKKHWSQAMLAGQIVTIMVSYAAVSWLSQPLWLLFPCAFLMTAFNYGYSNARMAILKLALPQSQQNIATARMSSLYSLMETVGPVLSGALLLFSQLHQAFLLLALIWLLAFWQLNRLDIASVKAEQTASLRHALAEGWRVFIQDRRMVLITLAVMVINTTDSVFWIQAIFFAKDRLALSAIEVGYMVAASGVGGVIAAFIADKIRRRFGLGLLLIASIALSALCFAGPVLWPSAIGLMATFFLLSLVGLFSNICIWSYRQEAFSQQHLGRIAGITGSLFKLLMPIGLATSGYWVARYGIGPVFYGCLAVQLGVAVLLLMSRVRSIK
ncbi:MFS transporter [Saccharospirillum sp. MSK14-1]|uniref:MFS transporter n=1 Tax=Saccharospirillum sp. MSK14-1 TaxID=1897632 RepID=UPI000D3584E3|nr:MFS transporter [Saccharospirillum sp. MSK14-1]PTY38453.1 MFS transporter [Saccharospirillum sp. MSK14-1]